MNMIIVWILVTVGPGPHTEYSPHLATQQDCNRMKAVVGALWRNTYNVAPAIECVPVSIPDTNRATIPAPTIKGMM